MTIRVLRLGRGDLHLVLFKLIFFSPDLIMHTFLSPEENVGKVLTCLLF